MSLRISAILFCGLPVLFSTIGCRVSGSTFQMDSDHRVPSLGLQLSPRKKRTPKKRTPKDGRSIRQTGVIENRSPESSPPVSDPVPQRSTWSRLLGRFGKPKRIPLPRTDIRSGKDASHANDSPDPLANDF